MQILFSDFKSAWVTILGICIICLTAISCGSKPKVIEPVRTEEGTTSQVSDMVPNPADVVHKVKVIESMNASRYTYVHVEEEGSNHWIAIPETNVEVGEIYYYKGGVRMHNFESKEHNRIFETLYLVGGISKSPTGEVPTGYIDMHGGASASFTQNIAPLEDGISLDELFNNKEDYDGKIVSIKGQCTKVNRQIMGKNWIHLQDGTKAASGELYDLTITTQEEVQMGQVAAFRGKITLNKDLGSGYRFDVLMEEATLISE